MALLVDFMRMRDMKVSILINLELSSFLISLIEDLQLAILCICSKSRMSSHIYWVVEPALKDRECLYLLSASHFYCTYFYLRSMLLTAQSITPAVSSIVVCAYSHNLENHFWQLGLCLRSSPWFLMFSDWVAPYSKCMKIFVARIQEF